MAGEAEDGVWLFGYGSLVWRPNIEHTRRVDGVVHGYRRRFAQGSPDHRGTSGEAVRVRQAATKD